MSDIEHRANKEDISAEMLSKCAICASELPDGARKCIQCNEYQQPWQRLLSKLQMQTLIALVPILTLAYTVIIDKVENKQSELMFSVVSCSAKNVHLFASNVGNSGAIIKSASYQSLGRPSLPFDLQLDQHKRLIEQDETLSIHLKVPESAYGGLVPPGLRAQFSGQCEVLITVETIAFDHKPEPAVMICSCPN